MTVRTAWLPLLGGAPLTSHGPLHWRAQQASSLNPASYQFLLAYYYSPAVVCRPCCHMKARCAVLRMEGRAHIQCASASQQQDMNSLQPQGLQRMVWRHWARHPKECSIESIACSTAGV